MSYQAQTPPMAPRSSSASKRQQNTTPFGGRSGPRGASPNQERAHAQAASSPSHQHANDPTRIGCYKIQQVLQQGPLFNTMLVTRDVPPSNRGQGDDDASMDSNDVTLHTLKAYNLKQLKDNPKLQVQVEREVTILRHATQQHNQQRSRSLQQQPAGGQRGIVLLDDTFYSQHYLFVVTRYNQGGDLFELLQEDNLKIAEAASASPTAGGGENKMNPTPSLAGFSMKIVRRIIKEVLQAVAYLHEEVQVCHRDIKLENVFLDEDNQVKIGGFGFAAALPNATDHHSKVHNQSSAHSPNRNHRHFVPEDQLLRNHCGSRHYVCPEIVREESYDGRLADSWSIGVLTFALATGSLPFFERDSQEEQELADALAKEIEAAGGQAAPVYLSVWEQIQNSALHLTTHREWTDRPWSADDPMSVRHFVMQLLHQDPLQRITPAQALNHPFITEDDTNLVFQPPTTESGWGKENHRPQQQQQQQQHQSVVSSGRSGRPRAGEQRTSGHQGFFNPNKKADSAKWRD